jgi:Zn-finger nucleic acid-binding protein
VGCALFGIYAAILAGMKRMFRESRVRVRGRGGGIILFLLLVFIVLSIMQFFFLLVRLILSRNRELRADAIAVRLTRDPLSLSEALYSISMGWRGMGRIDENLEPLFIINPVKAAVDEKEGLFADLFSTHPPIKKRIAILAQMAHADVSRIEEGVAAREGRRIDASAGVLKGSPYTCPKCVKGFVEEDYEGVIARRCLSCGGILVEKDKIERIIIRREKGFDERIKKLAEITQKDGIRRVAFGSKETSLSSLKCPRCAAAMVKNFYTMAYLVEVDECYPCGLIWLDKDELEILQYLIEERKVAQ